MTDTPPTSAPGWYPDPDPANPGGERFWFGTEWSKQTRTLGQPQQHGPSVWAQPPQSIAPRTPPKQGHTGRNVGIGVAVVVVLLIIVAVATGGGKKAKSSSSTTTIPVVATSAAPAATVTAAPTTAPTTPPVTAPSTTAGPATTFSDGTWTVGKQIAAGTYHTNGGADCYWERDSNLTGSESAILANGNTVGPVIVTILPTDAGFQTQGCGTWSPLPASGPQATTFGDGVWAVGVNIAPGTYSAPGGSNCYWERDSDFTGDESSILANDSPSGPVTVTVEPSDKAFQTQGCGTWTSS